MHDFRASCFCLALALLTLIRSPVNAHALDRACRQWDAPLEWSLTNPSYDGNPFDLKAAATFRHSESGEVLKTELFFDGDETWKFRFTANRPGTWTFETTSDDSDLHGKRGTISVRPASDPNFRGFVSHERNRWIWSANRRAFVPQIVMYRSPDGYYNQPDLIDQDLRTWFNQHGFNGLHTAVLCRWFDLNKPSSDDFDDSDPNPDPRTFRALELLITKAHAAGGFVHIWAWGDDSRHMTPIRWGINGRADQRLQRYIAARLGSLPGWTMGYGFDLWEWVDEDQLVAWHRNVHDHFGWPHLVGGRAHRHGDPLDKLITRRLDYIGYETHRPSYATYVEALERNVDRPVMMEDRFRIRDSKTYREKDYSEELTRRGLWHSAIAGGVANIWGYLLPDEGPHGMSRPYPNREQLRTNATFFKDRFSLVLARDSHITDGAALIDDKGTKYIFYKEDCQQIRVDLSKMSGRQPAVAVDARKAYQELDLGTLDTTDQMVKLPHQSDWAIAVGRFADSEPIPRR